MLKTRGDKIFNFWENYPASYSAGSLLTHCTSFFSLTLLLPSHPLAFSLSFSFLLILCSNFLLLLPCERGSGFSPLLSSRFSLFLPFGITCFSFCFCCLSPWFPTSSNSGFSWGVCVEFKWLQFLKRQAIISCITMSVRCSLQLWWQTRLSHWPVLQLHIQGQSLDCSYDSSSEREERAWLSPQMLIVTHPDDPVRFGLALPMNAQFLDVL